MGDAGDADLLARAFDGGDALFAMMPFDPQAPDSQGYRARLGMAVVAAIRRSGVRYIVALSSIGADVSAGTGVLTSLHAQEERLRALTGVNVLVLRPGSFFENPLAAVPAIEHEVGYTDVFAPHVPVPIVAIRDVAAAAVQALTTRAWTGRQVHELPGPHDLNYAEATTILGTQLGRADAGYMQLPAHDAVDVMAKHGCSTDAARHYVDFARALEAGVVRPREPRGAVISRSTSFEAFAAELTTQTHANRRSG